MNNSPIPIVQKGDPVLRSVATEVKKEAISTPELQDVIERMKVALASQEDGLAIAAPQIGISLRIFVISGKVFSGFNENDEKLPAVKTAPDVVFINPVIVKRSRKKEEMSEGCLSVRNVYGKVSRNSKAVVSALDEYGSPFERGGSGVLAQIFQHEIDHLDGVLFVDKAKEVEEIRPENKAESNQENPTRNSK